MPSPIDYLLIGHIAHDETPDGPQAGGTVAYAGITALAMGLRVGIVTSSRPDDPVLGHLDGLDGLQTVLIPAAESTIFRNSYTGAGRVQHLKGRAAVLTAGHIPPEWQAAPIVHLAPLDQELDPALVPGRFPAALVGITPQGWLRAWDESGLVYPVAWPAAAALLPAAGVTVLSVEDFGHDPAIEAAYAAQASRLVVTRAERGAVLYTNGQGEHFPALDIPQPCHPTGAGDVFAAALLAALHYQPGDWAGAVRAATRTAGVFVGLCSDPGAPSLATMQRVLADPRVRGA